MRFTNLSDVSIWIDTLRVAMTGQEFSDIGFIKPFHFTMLATECQRHGAEGITWNGPMQRFAARMGLWEALGFEAPVRVAQHDHTGRFLPIAPLRDAAAVNDYADALCMIVTSQGIVGAATERSLFIALTELLGNCFAHAAAAPNCTGITCAQSWPRGNLAQIAIVDPGIGIRASLSANQALQDRLLSENACELATELHITSKPGAGHSGYGLTVGKELFSQNGGNFILISGTEAYRRHGEREIRTTLPVNGWQGTIVVLEWRIDQPLDIGAVYNNWPLPDGMTNEDFDF